MRTLNRIARVFPTLGLFFLVGSAFAQAPSITSISAPRQVVTLGGNLTLSVAASGATGYQWKHNGTTISAATAANYSITGATVARDSGWYQAVALNGSGSTTSSTVFVLVMPSATQIVGWGSDTSGQLAIPTGLNSVVAIASGAYYNVALKADGTVATWNYGLTPPSGLNNVVAVAAGNSHGLALKADGTVVQWGWLDSGNTLPPSDLANVVAIAAGAYHSLAVKADGTVVVWGSPNNGATSVPAGLSGVNGVAGGYYFNLALKTDGSVVGWGSNYNGQSSVPAGLSNAIGIAAGESHSVILKADGAITMLGNSTQSPPADLSGVIAVAAGGSHDLALKSDGNIVAWGANDSGQSNVPPGLNRVFGIAAGYAYSLVLRDATGDLAPVITGQPANLSAFAGQSVVFTCNATGGTSVLGYQWRKGGVNIVGGTNAALSLARVSAADAGSYDVVVSNQLGTVTSQVASLTVNTATAVSTNPSGAQTIVPGQNLTLTATTALTGLVGYEWRHNGRTIFGATNANLSLANVTWRDAGAYTVIVTNSVGPVSSTPIFVNVSTPTQVLAWGNNSNGQISVPSGLNNVISVAAGSAHSLALKGDGTVVGWGSNFSGELNIPASLGSVIAIGARANFSMALKADGTVATWGTINYVPLGLANVVAIAAGYDYAMALKFDGTVAAWTSYNSSAGDLPANLNSVVAIAAGYNHRLALKANGTIVAWGYNGSGQTSIPVGLTNVIAIAAGIDHSLALKSDGTVVAWGYNGAGQTNVPAGLTNVAAIFATSSGSVAVRADGSVVTWGFVPTPMPSLSKIMGFAAGDNHALAVHDASGDTAPTISTHPTSAAVSAGQSVSFSVVASGQPAPTYQWRKNGVNIASATNSIFSLSNPQTSDAGNYDVVVTNSLGSVTSNAATLTVSGIPAITTQPVAVTVADGQSASLTVVATGTPAPTYQWRKNSVNITDATNATLAFNPAHFSDAGSYSVVVANSFGSTTSVSVSLTVTGPATILTQPIGQSVGLGGSLLLSVSAGGSSPLSYQWRKNGANIAGATQASLRFTDFQSADAGDYTVIVSNAFGAATSDIATLVAVAATPPSILTQPVSATLNVGNVASFGVIATSGSPLFYQWRKNGVTIFGATNATYIVGQAQLSSAGTFDVVVASAGGSVTSNPAVLTINSPVPAFTTQPQSATVGAGTPITLTAAASGVPTPTLQWRKDGVAIPAATSGALAFTAAQTSDAGTYDVVATNSAGTTTSNAATLTVLGASPTILTPPVGGTVYVGGAITLSVSAVGAPTLSYQWRRDGINLSGATNATLAIGNAQTFDTGDYTVVVSNPAGTAVSAIARVNVLLKPVSISARLIIGSDGALGFFLVEGTAPKQLLLRAIGPGLAPFGVSGLLPDPQLEVYDSAGALIASNNDWSSASNASAIATTTAAVGAFALANGSRDSAVLQSFAPGSYTVRASGAGGIGGVGFLELYDVDPVAGASTVPWVAVRGRVAAGDGVLVGGLGSNGRGVKSFLIRAVGPALGLTDAFANPAFMVVRDSTLVGSNDDWDAVASDGSAVVAATTRVAVFPLLAGSRDAAVVLTGNLHAGAHTVQVGGPAGTSGLVLLELHDLQADRPATFAPAVASPPLAQTLHVGDPLVLKVLAHGTTPLSYQWRKNGINLGGATTSALTFNAAQLVDGGSYQVVVTNALGVATSIPAVVTVQGAESGASGVHSVASGYTSGGTIVITNTITYGGTATSVAWSATLPTGWSYVSGTNEGDVKPAAGATGTIGWTWNTPPASPHTFTYTVLAPAGETGSKLVSASVILRDGTTAQTFIASPSPLTLPYGLQTHSADTNLDFQISLFELTRVIELYNTRNGTSRTGCYKVEPSGEDGFAADIARVSGSTVALTRYHSADTRGAATGTARDGAIDLFELTRVIELYNTRSGTVRTGQYHVQSGTEDGFAPGP